MSTSACIEALEGRRLLTAAASTPPFAPDDLSPIVLKNGVVELQGTNRPNAFTVQVTNDRIAVVIESTRPTTSIDTRVVVADQYLRKTVHTLAEAGSSPMSPTVTSANFPIDKVKSVIAVGGAAQDSLQMDSYTQAITTRYGIESVVVSIPSHGANKTKTVELYAPFSSPIPGVYAGNMNTWLETSADQIAAAHSEKASADLVFLGDSMMERLKTTAIGVYNEYFENDHPLDLGLAGDTTSQMLYRIIYQGLLNGINPKATIVLEIGTNDIALSDDPDQIAAGVKSVIDSIQLRLPDTKILLNSVLPRRTSFDNRIVNKVNTRLAAMADGNAVRVLDVTPEFSTAHAIQFWYRPNDIHLTYDGYQAWASAINNALADILE